MADLDIPIGPYAVLLNRAHRLVQVVTASATGMTGVPLGEFVTAHAHMMQTVARFTAAPPHGYPAGPDESLVDREAALLAKALHHVGAYPVEWPSDADGIRAWAKAHVAAGTDRDPFVPGQASTY